MAILEILEFPDPRLRNPAKKVEEIDDNIRSIVKDMLETMYHAEGIGLAATQVNIDKRIVVMDLSKEKNQPVVLINPELTKKEGLEEMEEGCLSFPGVYAKVQRAKAVTIAALNEQGETIEIEADELLSVCIQHELDHLAGKLFVDYLSPLKRQRIRAKMEKMHRK